MKSIVLLLAILALLLAGCAAPGPAAPAANTPTLPPAPATQTPDLNPIIEPTATTPPTAEPTATPTPALPPLWISYIDRDGNLRLMDANNKTQIQITDDSTGLFSTPGQPVVQYFNGQISSDGRYVAYRRDAGTPVDNALSFVSELWLYDVQTSESRILFENQAVNGLAWKPGAHIVAFGMGVSEGYFTTRGEIDASKARGIWAFDADSGENIELVAPERGFSLVNPRWSPTGRYLAFNEVNNYEGVGTFAVYDFDGTGQYTAWEGEAVGFTDWSPDEQSLAYDSLTYAPSGTERIFLRPFPNGEAAQFSPDYEVGYAFSPRFSPAGDLVAYLAEIGATDSQQFSLVIQPAAGGEPVVLGVFENAVYLDWMPDGSALLLSAGPFESRSVLLVSPEDGSVKTLAEGDAPALP